MSSMDGSDSANDQNITSSETEDEEVKMNCEGGCPSAADDYDPNPTTPVESAIFSDGDDSDDDTEDESRKQGVVEFVNNHVPVSGFICSLPSPTPIRKLILGETSGADELGTSSPLSCSSDGLPLLSSSPVAVASLVNRDPTPVGTGFGVHAPEDTEHQTSLGKQKRMLLQCGFMRKRQKILGHITSSFSSFLGRNSVLASCDQGSREFSSGRQDNQEGTAIIATSDDEELDRQLGLELEDDDDDCDSLTNDKGPVPLLTPPGSPLTVVLDGDHTTLCEWPYNLTVDSAMTAASELRLLSPASLEGLEREEEIRTSWSERGTESPPQDLKESLSLIPSVCVGVVD